MFEQNFELLELDRKFIYDHKDIQVLTLDMYLRTLPEMDYEKFYYICDENLNWIMNAYIDRDYKAFVIRNTFSLFLDEFEEKASEELSKNWKNFRILICDTPYFQRPQDDLKEALFVNDTIIYQVYKCIECGKILSFHKDHMLVMNKQNQIRKVKYTDDKYKSKGHLQES